MFRFWFLISLVLLATIAQDVIQIDDHLLTGKDQASYYCKKSASSENGAYECDFKNASASVS